MAAVEHLESRCLLSTSVLQYRYDGMNAGVNNAEVQLTPANVKGNSFGKLFSVPLDGEVYAQPVVQAGLMINSGVNTTAGAAGIHDVVFACTENDSIYAIDAGATGGQILWKRSFLGTANTAGNINDTLGATSIGVVTTSDIGGVQDVSPTVGITSTPVIDASTGILYVLAKTREVVGGTTFFVQRLHAINTSDGTDVVMPYTIGTTTNDNTNTTQIYCYGNGDGAVIDPYNNTGKNVVQFNALHEFDRVALKLVNNTVYIAWASHGDIGPYHGWIATWSVATIQTSGFQLSGVLCTSPNDGSAGIWQGGGGLSFEPDGSAFYFTTGNGSGGAPTLNPAGFPNSANYNEALVKAVADPTTSANNPGPNGWGLKVVDYFIPYNVVEMDNADSDFGSGAPLLLPDSAGIAGHPHLIIAGGKDGRLYVLDRNNLGHYNSSGDPSALNSVPNASNQLTPPNLIGGTLTTPTWFNNHLYAISGYDGQATQFSLSSTGQLVPSSQTALTDLGFEPGGTVVTANGVTDGIVWLVDRLSSALRAYDASSLSDELWNSNQGAGNRLITSVKFAEPTVANGRVYIGTYDSLYVYGLTQAPIASPQAPILTATTTSGSSINLTWTDATVSPNNASLYQILESTNGSPFTQVATAAAGATSIGIGALLSLTQYTFEIIGVNVIGPSAPSNIATATTANDAAVIDFANGFSPTNLTLNGVATIQGNNLQLTDGGQGEASTAFFNTPVNLASFTTQFSFQIDAGNNTADGFTFTLQNQDLREIGVLGGGLGYASATAASPASIAIKFDLFNNSGEGSDSTGLFENGATPGGGPNSIDLTGSGIDLHGGDTFNVKLTYDGTTLAETITDMVTNATVTENYTVNLPQVIGSNSAYAGFTAGTGGQTAVQSILNWTYSPTVATSPDGPSGLGATPASASSVRLVWTNNATNQTGYTLQRATDPNFTQNLVTQALAGSAVSFTDTVTGLVAGSTYYYQLAVFNSAGTSGYSTSASVSIPLPPPAPTKAAITNVTTNEIDLSWQDNAGHSATGYNILRQVNGGGFSVVASLPPTSRRAPSAYSWSDTALTPGTVYEYQIEAVNTSGNNGLADVSATTLSAAPVAVAVPGNAQVTLSWPVVQGAVKYNVYRGTTAGGEAATPVAAGIATTTFKDTTASNGVQYFYQVTAVNNNAVLTPPTSSESARSAEVSATPVAPSIFSGSIEVGAPALSGSTSFTNGTYTLTGSGSDIWNTSDQFHYNYQTITGNTTITGTITSVTKTNVWAKAAVMVRATTAANSAFADIVVTPGGYLAFEWRAKTGSVCGKYVLVGKPPTQTVKLIRSGNVFTAFYYNNNTWTQIGKAVSVAMPPSATAGLGVTSLSATARCTATFTKVTLT